MKMGYLKQCHEFAWQKSFKLTNAVCGGILSAVFFSLIKLFKVQLLYDETLSLVILFGVLLISFYITYFLLAPYYIWRKQEEKIQQLKKIDKKDLEHLLHGSFYRNTFIYGGDRLPCKKFVGKFEFDLLNNRFTEIRLQAPRNSVASVRFVPYNFYSNLHIYYIARDGKEVLVEDIYSEHEVHLNEESSFSIKLIFDNDHKHIDDDIVEFSITTESWTI